MADRPNLRKVQRNGCSNLDGGDTYTIEHWYGAVFRSDQAARILVNTPANEIVEVNPAVSRLIGYAELELIGKKFEDLFEIKNLQNFIDNAIDEKANPFIAFENVTVSRKDGASIELLITMTLFRWNGATFIHCTLNEVAARNNAEQVVNEGETKYRRLVENSPDIVYRYSNMNGGIYYSERVSAILGYTVKYMLDNPMLWKSSIHPDDAEDVRSAFQNYERTGSPFKVEYRIRDSDGVWRWFYDRAIAFQFDDGEFIIEGLAMDITERKSSQIRLAHLTRVQAILSGINGLIVRVVDRDELFRESCRIAVLTAGFCMSMFVVVDYKTGEAVPVASAGKSDELMEVVRSTLRSDKAEHTTMVFRAIGEMRPIVSNNSSTDNQVVLGEKYLKEGIRSIAVLPLIAGNHVQGVLALYTKEVDAFHDEELKLLQEMTANIAFAMDHLDKQDRLNYIAYYDVLTGLANRNLFFERLGQHVRDASSRRYRLAIGLIDLERFKNINDSYGRSDGDLLLKQVADWLVANTGDASLVARIGADHFGIIFPSLGPQGQLSRLVEKLSIDLRNTTFMLAEGAIRVNAKFGFAQFPRDGSQPDVLIRKAESALKGAKATGERYLFHQKRMTAKVASNVALEKKLRLALDREEFLLHYQPKVRLSNGRIIGAEALIRWANPHDGLVLPSQFIPVLEEIGLIGEVSRWAMERAADDYLRWLDSGLAAVRIAVNVSPLQLRQRGFVDEVAKVIGRDRRLSEGLELEITENMAMADVGNSIKRLKAIRDMGVCIAIDDFGTGFSSLSYLSRLPLDVLKIDRSFIVDMTESSEGLSLVDAIINMSHALRLKVVAEGVENEKQLAILKTLKCDNVQGYLLSKPIDTEAFEAKFLSPTFLWTSQ
jgi:diguanylate cyclase (GGDEF)-like protein/PAS domain S-box-containing protein